MDKKPVANTAQKNRPGIRDYFKGVKTEIKKVVWPTRKEMVTFTSVVILTCFVASLVFWGFNSGVLALLKVVLNISI